MVPRAEAAPKPAIAAGLAKPIRAAAGLKNAG